MCGIAGKISLTSDSITVKEVTQLTDAIAHRGPDDSGHNAVTSKVVFGQRRLAIIDLSPGGHQPMTYKHNRYWITFNGEIYNYQELRKQLKAKGYTFKTQSDTEVILALFAEYGERCVRYLRGMFAFAIYDKKTETLFAARDRLGKKPFKYFFDGKVFIFASELKALFSQSEVPRELDPTIIEEYVYWGFVPSPKTGFKNIFKLPAAHSLTLRNGKISVRRYWDYKPDYNTTRTYEETKDELRELLTESVRLRLISDVPVGAFLSGGIDSTIIVGLMSQLSKEPVRTFTIGFKNWENDESAAAAVTAAFHHTKHTLLTVSPKIQQVLPKIVTAYEEPFGDTSAVPSYYVSQAARKHVTVALNGDGGDENFFGYSNYETLLFNQQTELLSPLAALGYEVLKPLQPALQKFSLYQRALRVSDIMRDTGTKGYAKYARGYLNYFGWNDLFLSPSTSPEKLLQRAWPTNAPDAGAAVVHHDLHSVLPDGLMPKVDIASMQHALEARAPFLDHKLVEFAASIPLEYKYRNGVTKSILRETFADLIPEHVRHLPKRGFVLPTAQWIKGELQPLFQRTLGKPSAFLYSFIRFETVQSMMRLHAAGAVDYSSMLWRLLMLELWHQTYFNAEDLNRQ